jgi:hypothetical protein
MNRLSNGGRHSRFKLQSSLAQSLIQVKGTLIADNVLIGETATNVATEISQHDVKLTRLEAELQTLNTIDGLILASVDETTTHLNYGDFKREVWSGVPTTAANFEALCPAIGISFTALRTFNTTVNTNIDPQPYSYSTTRVPGVIHMSIGWSHASSLTRWQGVFHTRLGTGAYGFRVLGRGAGMLYINGTLVCDGNGMGDSHFDSTGVITLTEGSTNELVFVWYNSHLLFKACQLYWAPPDAGGVYSSYKQDYPSSLLNFKVAAYNVTRQGTGQYTITFNEGSKPTTNSYTISLTTQSMETGVSTIGANMDDYMIAYYNKTSSGFQVSVKEQDDGTVSGSFRDCQFDFICVSRASIFCHGSVTGVTGQVFAIEEYDLG